MRTVLMIDDDPRWISVVQDWLHQKGYEVLAAHSGTEGLEKAKGQKPDLIILGLVFEPDRSGFQRNDILAQLRHEDSTAHTPIVMCLGKGNERLKRIGVVREGSDPVIPMTKECEATCQPIGIVQKYDLRKLELVVARLLCQPQELQQRDDVVRVSGHELRLSRDCTKVWLDGIPRVLTPLESEMLALLNASRGTPVGVETLATLWYKVSEGMCVFRPLLRVIRRLRQKIEPDPRSPIFLLTVRARGFKLVEGSQ